MNNDIDALLESIRDYRRHQGWSINKLANEADVPWSVLQGMDESEWSPSLKTLRSLLSVVRGKRGSTPRRPRRPPAEARAS